MAGPLTLSMKELDRLQVLTRIAERRLTRRRAAELLQIGERQVRRLYRASVQDGAAGLVSRRRGRPSARRLPAATQERALALIRERYADFGPTPARWADRGQRFTLLVYVDDATSRLMELCFADTESTLLGAKADISTLC